MMARRTVLLAAALLVGGVTACSDLTGANARADGVYYLQSVNNNTIPYSYTDNGQNRSYTESGTWTQSNNVVTFYPNQSSTGNLTTYTAVVGNSSSFGGTKTLQINFSGTIWFYSE